MRGSHIVPLHPAGFVMNHVENTILECNNFQTRRHLLVRFALKCQHQVLFDGIYILIEVVVTERYLHVKNGIIATTCPPLSVTFELKAEVYSLHAFVCYMSCVHLVSLSQSCAQK